MLQGQISCQRVLIEERHRLLRNISSSCEDVNNYTSLGMVATKNLYLELLDVKTTFLHDDLEEDIYMNQSCSGTRESSLQIEKELVWPKASSKTVAQEIL